ncbi:MAG: BREX system ATP-binding domain-containing protein [Chloroflexota bacterium]
MVTNQIQEQAITSNRRYRLNKQLGQGGMGVVYQATDRLTSDTVALKQVRKLSQQTVAPNMSKDNLYLALAHEFQIMAGLRHPHIISVLDYGFDVISEDDTGNNTGNDTEHNIENNTEATTQPFYTMTYLPDAQTILDAAQDQPFAYRLDLIQQLLQALAYLHRRGVLHRDLKPANVLVHQQTVRLLDFGLAVTVEEANVFSSAGTPLYMAPELFDGEPYSPQADLFVVGVLATQMLTGEHPFAPLDFAFLDRVLNADPNLGTMDERLHPLVHQLLAKTPERRFGSANDVLLALSKALDTPHSAVVETTAIRESYLQAATFVGREQEMTQLLQALDATRKGQGSAWLIGGESGVGKSRFVREVRTQALVAGFIVLVGQVEETQGGVYALWREPLRHLLVTQSAVTDLDAGVLLPVVPDVAQLLGRPVKPAPSLAPEAAQIRLFSTIAKLFEQVQQPIFLLLEDIHWADESLLVLPYLTRQIEDQSMLLLATYRDDERPQLPGQLSDMRPLHLGRLTSNNMADLSAAMLGEIGAQENILQMLQRETEGNAFFAVEVIRTLAEDIGGLQHIGQMAIPDTLLPNGIQTIVERRFAQVAEADRPLLLLAAVSGRVLDLAMILLLNQDRPLNHWITRCADAAILEVVDDRWQFRHAKLRDGLLSMLSADETQHYHQKVAEAIEQLYPDDANYAAQLMEHWRAAQHPEKEYGYAYLAGTHAAAQYANTDALTYLTRAYELAMGRLGAPQKQYETLLARESLAAFTGQSDDRKADLALLTALIAQTGTSQQQSEVALRQAGYALVISDFPAVETFAQAAIPLAQAARDNQLLAHAYHLLGQSWSLRSDFEQAQTAYLEARTLAELAEDDPLIASVLISLGDIEDNLTQFDQATDYYKQSLHIYQAIDDEQGTANALYNIGRTVSRLARHDEANVYLQESLGLFQRIGDRQGQSRVFNSLSLIYERNNDWATAEAVVQQALDIDQQIGNKHGVSVSLGHLGYIASMRGDEEQSYAYYLASLQIHEEIGHKEGETIALLNLGSSYTPQKGVYRRSKDYLERSIVIAHEIGLTDVEGCALMHIGNTFNRVGQYTTAQQYIDASLTIFRETELAYWESVALMHLGESYLSQQQFDQAQTHLQRSLVLSKKTNSPNIIIDALTGLAWCMYQCGDYAQMLAHYQELLPIVEERQVPHQQAEVQVGFALAHVLATHQWVDVDIAPSIDYIENEPALLVPHRPFRLHLLCYHLLTLMDEPYADTLLSIAYAQLHELANLIEDETWRASYLGNVPKHQEVIRLYTEMVEG